MRWSSGSRTSRTWTCRRSATGPSASPPVSAPRSSPLPSAGSRRDPSRTPPLTRRERNMTQSTNVLDLDLDLEVEDLERLDAPFEIVDFLLGAAAGVVAADIVVLIALT